MLVLMRVGGVIGQTDVSHTVLKDLSFVELDAEVVLPDDYEYSIHSRF